MRAWLNLRHSVPERARAFHAGLARLGYTVVGGCTTKPGRNDILVTWNRITEGRLAADAFEERGRPVIVAENATWGNDFQGGHWYTLARQFHNLSGRFPIGDSERWDSLRVDLPAFRTEGETVILPQRGIGPPGVAMPQEWTARALKQYGGRVRQHPGRNLNGLSLEADLAQAGRAITWGSGAGVRALLMGIPTIGHLPGWIGSQDNTEEGRLAMFRRLAWAQWRLSEIASGEPFERLLA